MTRKVSGLSKKDLVDMVTKLREELNWVRKHNSPHMTLAEYGSIIRVLGETEIEDDVSKGVEAAKKGVTKVPWLIAAPQLRTKD